MTTPDLTRIAETAETARKVGDKVKDTWATRNALIAVRDAKDPHTEAHQRFCNSESEMRSVIQRCKEPHFDPSTLNHLITYFTGWAKQREAHRDDLLASLQELVATPTPQEEDTPHD